MFSAKLCFRFFSEKAFSYFSDLGLFLQYAFLCCEPKEVFFTIAAFGDNKPQRNSVIWGIGGDYPPTSKNANVYTFALLARNELVSCHFCCRASGVYQEKLDVREYT